MSTGKLGMGRGRLGVGQGKLGVGRGTAPIPEENLEQETEREITGLARGFEARRAQEAKRLDEVSDSEYWCCFYFQSREQKETFLRALKLIDLGDKYVEGQEAARRLGVTLPPGPRWQTRERSAARLVPLAMKPR